MAQAAQMGQGSALGFLGIAQQAAGSADGQCQVFAAEALEVLGGELLAEALECRVTFEIPGGTTSRTATLFSRQALGPVIRDQQLYRVDALQLRQQVFPRSEERRVGKE